MKRAATVLSSLLLSLTLSVLPIGPRTTLAAAPALPSDRLHFGLANGPADLGWMTSSGVPWRYRYQYLSAGVNTAVGWETWHDRSLPPGQFAADYMAASTTAPATYLPVFTYYEICQSNGAAGPAGCTGNESAVDYNNLNNTGTMAGYYGNFKLLMQKVGAYGKPVVIHVEPDFWGYMQHRAAGQSAAAVSAMVKGSGFAEVAGIDDTVQGFGWALLKLRDLYAPNAVMAIHASLWASGTDIASDTNPAVNATAVADATAAFLNSAGISNNPFGSTWDAVFNDVDDHDAAWWEATGRINSYFTHWWDRRNVSFPNFNRYLAWVTELHARTNRPQIVWQVPVGNQYFLTMNNTCGHYQDNVAEYFIAHPADLFSAGIIAVLFGAGNACQTTYTDAQKDGITNNGGRPTTDTLGGCNACNTQVSQYADDDGGYLRLFVGQYYSCTTAPVPPVASGSTTFYFAEGYTGAGFKETLSLLMPNLSGTATIDYFTQCGHLPTVSVPLNAGQVLVRDVNGDVGPGMQVSARVSLPAAGMVERTINFNWGPWHGSTDQVGVTAPSVEWDFAEGSTLSIFAEYLSIQNSNGSAVTVDLNYFTDTGAHPTKTLSIPANTRVTVVVYSGDQVSNLANCAPLVTCGVGPGIVGVSVQVKSRSLPIVAERPFYVMNYSFGSGPIRDGHDAFGAKSPGKTWNFAEGTTQAGFNEYLTLQNPQTLAAHVSLKYIYDLGVKTVALTVNPQSRLTVLVFDQAYYGVGSGYIGVSVQVTSDQPIVAERPMYMVHDFGSGPVAGAHVVVGATTTGTLFGFSAASTLNGDNDYLTIQNSNAVAANITVDYYRTAGKLTRTFVVAASTRATVLVFDATQPGGAGPGLYPLGIVVSSDQPILVEKVTYSSAASPTGYGATVTLGYSPGSF
jgi:hypothetical protein